tara:strand:+ start:948 stop:1121 length:174 start_codon:yes stop_codon:yes gene_type:complete
LAANTGNIEFGLGVVNGIGKLDSSLSARIDEGVSLFASAGVDTSANWQAMAGLKIEW